MVRMYPKLVQNIPEVQGDSWVKYRVSPVKSTGCPKKPKMVKKSRKTISKITGCPQVKKYGKSTGCPKTKVTKTS